MTELIPRKNLSPSTLDDIDQLQSSLKPYAAQPSLGMAYGRENKYATWNFSESEFKTIEIIHLTDVQFGHINCNVPQLKKYLDWILDKPNRYILLGGDLTMRGPPGGGSDFVLTLPMDKERAERGGPAG